MLEKVNEKLRYCQFKTLEQHFESEDLAKEILFYGKDKGDFEIEERRKFLDKRISKRNNLYIYPEKVNV